MASVEEVKNLLQSYMDFSGFLCRALGSQSNVIIYDIDEDGTNGKVISTYLPEPGKEMGTPMTPLIRGTLKSIREKGHTELTHIDTKASTAGGRVKLNIFPIRAFDKELIGIFIIQTNIDVAYEVREFVNQLLGFDNSIETSVKVMNVIDENFSLSQYTQQLIQDKIDSYAVPVDRMTMEEKRQIVTQLEKLEVFYVRDSVRVVANLLKISVPTVYRLLKQE